MTGRVGDIVLMVFLLLVSLAFLLWELVLPALEARAIRSWIATPCEITHSEVRRTGGIKHRKFRFDVTYTYAFGGTTHTGQRPKLGSSWARWRVLDERGSTADDLAKRFPLGMRTTCYVNPEAPSESILDPTFSLSLLHALFALFVVLTGYGVYWAIRRRGKKDPLPG